MLRSTAFLSSRTRHSWRRAAANATGNTAAGIQDRAFNPRSFKNAAQAQADRLAAARAPILEQLDLAESTSAPIAPPLEQQSSGASKKGFVLSARASMKRGADVAHETKSMSDSEWQAVPLSDKHSFVKYISQKQPL
jgi:hypothetical protein